MPDSPPPLPVAGPAPARAMSAEFARMAPPHAPLFWRTLALLVDASLFGLLGYLLLTRWLIPEYHPEALSATLRFFNEYLTLNETLMQRVADGQLGMESAMRELGTKIESAPGAMTELAGYCSSTMTLIFWIGFALSEILTGGSSLGKRMFRLRVATFPYAEKPGVFDSLVRNGWKAMALTTLNPLAMIFAIVDAHWPLLNPLRRSIHDYLSRTIVLDARFDPPEKPKADDDTDDNEDN